MGKCHELYPCLKQVQHSFIEYKKPVNCNALKTLHVWENVMNFILV